ncbi:hypothetical protein ACWKWP_14175 [Agromyces soli]
MTAVITRRLALGAGVAAVGAAALAAPVPASAASAGAGTVRTAAAAAEPDASGSPLLPVRSQFAGREGLAYSGASQWATHRLVLLDLDDLQGRGDPEHRFAVRFTTDAGARDGLYRLSASGEPDAVLYLVRVGGESSVLEAVVDRAGGRA